MVGVHRRALCYTHRTTSTGWCRRQSECRWWWRRWRLYGRRRAGPTRASVRRASTTDCRATRTRPSSPAAPPLQQPRHRSVSAHTHTHTQRPRFWFWFLFKKKYNFFFFGFFLFYSTFFTRRYTARAY